MMIRAKPNAKCLPRLELPSVHARYLLVDLHEVMYDTRDCDCIRQHRIRVPLAPEEVNVHSTKMSVEISVMYDTTDCDCTRQHRIRVCLAPEEVNVHSTKMSVEISVSSGPDQWQEGNVEIISKWYVIKSPETLFDQQTPWPHPLTRPVGSVTAR